MSILKYHDEFEKALDGYGLSRHALRTLQSLSLTLLVAPSSSGRNTIIRELMKTDDFHFIVSDTTRKPRSNDGVMEQDGREYWFRSEDEILADIKKGEFLEAAIIHDQQVSGISIRELAKSKQEHKIAITDIEIVGAENIHILKPDTHFLFIVPPSFDVWLQRLRDRGHLPEDEVRRRLQSAMTELEAAVGNDYYKFVVNDVLQDAVARVYEISKLGIINPDEQQRGRDIAEILFTETQAYLDKS